MSYSLLEGRKWRSILMLSSTLCHQKTTRKSVTHVHKFGRLIMTMSLSHAIYLGFQMAQW